MILRIHGHAIGMLAALCGTLVAAAAQAQSPEVSDWAYYGGDAFGQHYSSLEQVRRDNVNTLTEAWTYRTGELGAGLAAQGRLVFDVTPVLAFGLLYLETAANIVIALDPVTGKERWRYDPRIDRSRDYPQLAARGVSIWEDPDASRQGACTHRIFVGTHDARLLALDAATGRPCSDFGNAGQIDLDPQRAGTAPAYTASSPPAILGDLVVVGAAIADKQRSPAVRGLVRAFDARSGALRWSFDPLPGSGEHPAAPEWDRAQAVASGGADASGVISVDEEHGYLLVPTGSASPEFFGGHRSGSNRLANSLLALEGSTGHLVWQQQLVHHDLWASDLEAQPALLDINIRGIPVPAVIEATRSGMLYAFDRIRGQPLFAVTERPVPASHLSGEQAAATQPVSALAPLVAQRALQPDDAWGLTFWDRNRCRELLAAHRNEGPFTPPDTRGSIISPGVGGGVSWGGIAVDEEHQRVFAAVNRLPMLVTLMPVRTMQAQQSSGEYPYATFARQAGTEYAVRREPLLSPWGLPCTAPPWGTLASVDLRHNRIVWEVPLGSSAAMLPWFIPTRDFGTPNRGGPIVTAGGLVFVAAATDGYLRAFDYETGRELWKHSLPAGGQATPMTYRAGPAQRQFIVIAAGGDATLGTARGDYVVAFALPEAAGR
ncbi:MAG: pyrroloquinoline quinone-dependent dehydrogenase [Sinobacteraceae bacterium]|nr:pyrroloquinoline quinone-dependent dehydrogenase [Nevskiaceae bacterium]